ncbi:hypothetical protein MPSI1_002794 [Malassezia psittaci]|uniref:Uncharacterized protein n=1 Tax=Malassezia psittaci TaxID=1821823 RepID=A0AAF0JEW9_9BASI|nr:hypothetical protein MPSI1_002794 [Malassezia psittaci]
MPTLALKVQADLQNVTRLIPSDGVDSAILIKLECNSCRETHPNAVLLDPSNVAEMQRGRGEANLVMQCPNCRHENSATYVVRKPGGKGDLKLGEIAPWSELDAEKMSQWQTLCTVDFRGLTPLEPQIDALLPDGATWTCYGTESGTKFADVQFEDGEWHDYDEKAGDEVGIADVRFQWQKI